jgi:glycosyltransferase involved in cell wall biosynthesis
MVHVFVKKLVDEWAKMGHTCVVISPLSMIQVWACKEKKAPQFERQLIESGVYVDVYRPRYYSIPKIKISNVSLSGYSQQCCIERTIKKIGIRFDAIYCHFYIMAAVGWHYACLNSIPLFVATGESTIPNINNPCRSFTPERLKNDLNGVVAVSSKNRDEAIQKGYAKVSDIKVFPNAANLKLFHRMDKKQCRVQLSLPLDKFILICVGQFVERKGQKRVLKAIDKLQNNDIKSIFIGNGEDQFEHDSIIFKGTISNKYLPLYLNSADAFVLPTRNEGCCNAIIEALACGLPIISSNRPFNYDVLNNMNSILIDPDDTNAIAEAINILYKNADLRQSMAQKSYEMGENLSIELRAKKILGFIQSKIRERAQR